MQDRTTGLLACLTIVLCATAAVSDPTATSATAPADDGLSAAEKDLQWFRDAKFGLFIHWGPVSLTASEIGFSRAGEHRGSPGEPGPIPAAEYDNLYKRFNPVRFDAKQWVAIAKNAGMKYVVFVAKHLDGFCMFDSRHTDYKITNSPFGRDVAAELAKACHEAGLRLGFYYQPSDWYNPDRFTVHHARYVEYMHNQLRELCTNYGPVSIIWFDAYDSEADVNRYDAPGLFRMIRRLQPGVLINNRLYLPGDFDTPEQVVGKFQTDRPWETCMTIGSIWAWGGPTDHVKPYESLLRALIRCAVNGGNLLLNVGPMPTGEIDPRNVERLKQMGEWTGRFGDSIYGTRGGPYILRWWGGSTYKGNKVYLHLFRWDEDVLTLPPLPRKVVRSSAMTGGKPTVTQDADAIRIRLDPADRHALDTIIVLELEGPLPAMPPIRVGHEQTSLTRGRQATGSNVYMQMKEVGPAMAVDGDNSSRWATDADVTSAWLEVDLDQPATFGRALIQEAYDRVQEFELQYRDGDEWLTWARGTTIGAEFVIRFPPVTARSVRLNVVKSIGGPTICEFHLYPH